MKDSAQTPAVPAPEPAKATEVSKKAVKARRVTSCAYIVGR